MLNTLKIKELSDEYIEILENFKKIFNDDDISTFEYVDEILNETDLYKIEEDHFCIGDWNIYNLKNIKIISDELLGIKSIRYKGYGIYIYKCTNKLIEKLKMLLTI